MKNRSEGIKLACSLWLLLMGMVVSIMMLAKEGPAQNSIYRDLRFVGSVFNIQNKSGIETMVVMGKSASITAKWFLPTGFCNPIFPVHQLSVSV